MVLISKPFVSTDGGRVEAGINDKNDCAVRAYALFKGIPYEQAHSIFTKLGRKNGHGTSLEIIESAMGKQAELHWKDHKRIPVSRLRAMYPQGRVYAIKRGHAFTMIDGVLHDTYQVGAKCQVFQYWVDGKGEESTPVEVQAQPKNLRAAAGKIINSWDNRKLSVSAMVALVARELNITSANARYYVTRVWGFAPI